MFLGSELRVVVVVVAAAGKQLFYRIIEWANKKRMNAFHYYLGTYRQPALKPRRAFLMPFQRTLTFWPEQ